MHGRSFMINIFVSLLFAKVYFHIVSAQYSAVSIAVEFVMWMSAVVQVWFSFSQRSRCCIVCRPPHQQNGLSLYPQ